MRDTDRFRSSRWLDPKQALLILGAAVLVFAILMARAFVSTYSKHFDTAVVHPRVLSRTQRFAARAMEQADLTDTVASIARGMTDAQAESLANQLAPLGITRLDSAQLIERAQLLLQMLEQDSANCDARATVAPGDNALGTGIAGLDSASLEKWSELYVAAAGAQIRGSPAPAEVTNKDSQQLGDDLVATMGDSSFNKWSKIVADKSKASPAEQCWAERAMYRAVMSLPVGEQARDLRTLAVMEAETKP